MAYVPAADTCWMFLVRHAATPNNLATPPLVQGCASDPSLNEAGRAQANHTAAFLADQPISFAYASPLRRALETATIIGRPHELTPLPCPPLHEVDVGRWEGRSWSAIERAEPEAFRLFRQDPATYGYGGGENLEQVCRRALPAALDIMRRHLGSIVLVAGHNVVNRVLLASWMNLPLAKARGIEQDNCGVNVIRFRHGQAHVVTLNAAFHLPPPGAS